MTDLFSLVGKVVVEGIDEAKKQLNDLGETGEQSSSKLSGTLSKVGGVAKSIGKVVAVGVTATATAVAVLGKQSIQAYADYEQLVGGVETLFKDSADKLMDYAKKAYVNQGLSANQYMETATSFSASLLQGLEGDTDKAVEYTNRAITDMSDNANKMGTDISLIQNAYQGFAKQNYMMLDNLKLGYGGTKEEMERLIEDASKMTDVQKELGIEVDASSLSFDNIINAISVVQKNLDITGTTSKEALGTITGSVNMLKGAWSNLLVGMSDDSQDFGELMDNVTTSLIAVVENVIPRIQTIFSKLPVFIQQLTPQLMSIINGILPLLLESATQLFIGIADALPTLIATLVTAVIDAMPLLIDGIIQVIEGIVANLNDIITPLIVAIPQIVMLIVIGLLNSLPTLIQGVVDLINGIVEALPQIIQTILEYIPQIITSIVNVLIEGIPILIEGAITFLNAIVEAIPMIIPMLIEALPLIITTLINGLIEAIPLLLDGAVQLLMAIIQAIPIIIQQLIPQIPTIVTAMVTTLIENLPVLIQGAIQLMMGIIEAIPQIALEVVKATPQIVQGLIEGLLSGLSALGDAVMQVGDTILGGIKDFFGIHSPSSVMEEQGDYLVQGMMNGIASMPQKTTEIFNQMKAQITAITNEINTAISNIWANIYKYIQTSVANIKTIVTNVFTQIKMTMQTELTASQLIVTTIFTNIKEAVAKTIDEARESVRVAIEKMRSYFNFTWSLPHLKLPHISISGSFNLDPPSAPTFSVSWYKNGGILDGATIFGMGKNGNLLGGGEDGAEAVAPLDTLMDYVQTAVDNSNNVIAEQMNGILSILSDYLPQLSERQLVLDTGALVGGLADDMDSELGTIKRRKDRQ